MLIVHAPLRLPGRPVQHDGRVLMRAGVALVPMGDDQLRAIYRETEPDFPSEICPGAQLGDLAPEAVASFRTRWAKKSDDPRLLSHSNQETLAAAELLTDEGLTHAALLLFGTRAALGRHLPQAEVVFEYRSSEAPGPAQDRDNLREGFLLFHDALWERINRRNDRQSCQNDFFRVDILTFDEGTIREAVLNAVGHRDYRLAGSTFVRQYTRRLEVVSPGGFPLGITVENVPDQQQPRTRRLAEAFQRCGLIERSGHYHCHLETAAIHRGLCQRRVLYGLRFPPNPVCLRAMPIPELASLLPFTSLAMISGAELIEAVPIIISLIVIEGLLSVDNALAIAAMASHLPGPQKVKALRYGIIGAYVFRGLTLAIVAWIIANQWIKILGAAYLIYLMCSHLTQDEEGGGEGGAKRVPNFWMTVLQIEIMDLSLSIDNVVAAVALSPKLWIVVTGVFIGIAALRLLAGYCIKLIEKFPILGKTAFLLVGYVGFLLLTEMFSELVLHRPLHVGSVGKFIGICIIVALTLVYDRVPVLQTIARPFIAAAMPLMRAFAALFGLLLWLPNQVFRITKSMVVRHRPAPGDVPVVEDATPEDEEAERRAAAERQKRP